MEKRNKAADSCVYVIDKDYHILYFNDALLNEFPDLKKGDLCYDILCAENAPCAYCPLKDKENNTSLFYNHKKNRVLEVNTAGIYWPEAGDCALILCKPIHQSNKNLLYNLTNITTYDELFELNLTKDYYRTIFHIEDKYALHPSEGKFSSLIAYISDHLVPPDEKALFLKFWDLDQIRALPASGRRDPLRGEFRKKLLDGSYCWVQLSVVFLPENKSEDLIVMLFIQDISYQKEQTLRQARLLAADKSASSKDYQFNKLTGLYRRSYFFDAAREFLSEHPHNSYCLMAIDIEHFKLFNEWYGTQAGDEFLINIGTRLKKVQDEHNGIAGYIGGDNFAIILPNDPGLLKRLQAEIMGFVRHYGDNAGFMPAFGLYNITDTSIPVSTMHDRALLAQESLKGNFAQRVCWYDADMMRKVEEDHLLLTEVQHALANGELTFYAQPKCHMATGKIIGLESLIRWNHPQKGVLKPSEFLPILEQNGLITDIDMYIWELVCKNLQTWIARGHKPVPISVNLSRVDIYSLNVPETFQKLIAKYGLDPRLVEIEITESAYAENFEQVKQVVEELRKAGFTVLMDDFGSGYSSLNMLKDVNVDVLKIDMAFLDMNAETAGKGMGILEAITSMARLIDLKLIAEGVETREQVEFLSEMGCYYAQGYYFYQPLPIEDFESLLADESLIDYRGINARQLERLHIRELLDDNLFSETLLNNILGGIAFYDIFKGELTLLRANDQYYKIAGANPVDLLEKSHLLLNEIYPEDLPGVMEIFSRARQNPLHGAEGSFRKIKGDKTTIWMHLRAFFLRERDEHSLFYGSISDITDQKNQEQQYWLLTQKMEQILKLAGINNWDWDIRSHSITLTNNVFSDYYIRRIPSAGIKSCTFENFPDCFLSHPFFPPEYRNAFLDYLHQLSADTGDAPAFLEFPIYTDKKHIVWIRSSGIPIRNEKGEILSIVGYFIDITRQKKDSLRRQQLKRMAETDPLTGLYNRLTAINKIKDYLALEKYESASLIMMDLDNFKLANDVFGHAYGDSLITQTAVKIRSFFRSDDILCRIGGDEFLILCKNIREKDVQKKLERLVDVMQLSLKKDRYEIQFSVSVGYAMIPEQGTDFGTLYQCADIALFTAKENGKHSFAKYEPSMKAIRYELVKKNTEDHI